MSETKKLNILFCASPEFSIPTLKTLHTLECISSLHIATQPDQPAGRGKKTKATPIKLTAQDLGYSVSCPATKQDFENLVTYIKPDLIIVIAYGMILPKNITDNYLCINAHASLLPKYRGASPIQAALLNNDTASGITLIHMNEKMDEGDILMQQAIGINPSDTCANLHDKLALSTAKCISSIVLQISKNIPLNNVPQDHKNASYCHKLNKESFYLNPNDHIDTNMAKIRAFSPKPGAYSKVNTKRIKILTAHTENNRIIPLTVQPEGKPIMSFDDFKRGCQDPIELC